MILSSSKVLCCHREYIDIYGHHDIFCPSFLPSLGWEIKLWAQSQSYEPLNRTSNSGLTSRLHSVGIGSQTSLDLWTFCSKATWNMSYQKVNPPPSASWPSQISILTNKAQNWLHLRKGSSREHNKAEFFCQDLVNFYRGTKESVLTGNMTNCHGFCTVHNRKALHGIFFEGPHFLCRAE